MLPTEVKCTHLFFQCMVKKMKITASIYLSRGIGRRFQGLQELPLENFCIEVASYSQELLHSYQLPVLYNYQTTCNIRTYSQHVMATHIQRAIGFSYWLHFLHAMNCSMVVLFDKKITGMLSATCNVVRKPCQWFDCRSMAKNLIQMKLAQEATNSCELLLNVTRSAKTRHNGAFFKFNLLHFYNLRTHFRIRYH